ncbi:MAG: pyridoxamine 5'-phosphate oxidase family protein [Candidatus Bathyarchaeota archaeon]|nr:pyridoxamine 5'-phosphate oxidase family protein [Candidatus Bathyarchaeota archaeon]
MVTIPAEAKEVFNKQRIIPFATVDSTGKPNNVVVAFWWFEGDDTIVIVDNFLGKSRKNLEATKWAAVNAYDMSKHLAYQIKGKTEIQTSGKHLEKAKLMVKEAKTPMEMPAKAVVILKAEEIYFMAPGPKVGQKID